MRESVIFMSKKILCLVFIFVVACHSATKNGATSLDVKKFNKSQNSYYYYLMSEVKGQSDLAKDSDLFLEQALKKNMDSAFLWSQKAMKEAQKANIDDALKLTQLSLQKNPDDFDALLLLGKLYSTKGKHSEALKTFKTALNQNDQSEEVYNLIAREYIESNDTSSGIQTLKSCITDLPETMTCLYYLASIYLDQKNYNEALKYFILAKQLNPDNPNLLQTIGDIYIQKKQYQKALDIFNQLKQLYPDDMTQSIRLGLIYYELERVDEAISEFEIVQKKFPDSDRMQYYLGLLYIEKKELQTAYNYFDQIKEDSQFFKEALNRQIYILREQGKVENAVALMDKRISKKNQTEEVVALKISILIYEKKYKKALTEINQAMDRFQTSKKYLLQRAIIYEKLGRWDDARADLETLIDIEPDSEQAYNYLGYTMLERGDDIDEALKYINKAVQLKPNDGHIMDSLGWAYYKKKDYQNALKLLQKANRYRPKEPAILEHLGDVYFSLKNKRLARIYYEQAITILDQISMKTDEDEELLKRVHEKLAKF